jgi:aerobic C4-dicarboxylate transport protein
MTAEAIRPAARHQPWYKVLYVQVLVAIALGVLIGYFYPDLGKELKPLGDGFIALIKMMIAPVIFCTVVHGISSMGDLKRVGRVGLKSLVYFEAVSTVALAIGLIVGVRADRFGQYLGPVGHSVVRRAGRNCLHRARD